MPSNRLVVKAVDATSTADVLTGAPTVARPGRRPPRLRRARWWVAEAPGQHVLGMDAMPAMGSGLERLGILPVREPHAGMVACANQPTACLIFPPEALVIRSAPVL